MSTESSPTRSEVIKTGSSHRIFVRGVSRGEKLSLWLMVKKDLVYMPLSLFDGCAMELTGNEGCAECGRLDIEVF